MAGGRPQEYDRIKIGQDMVNWAMTNPDALTVPMFAVSIGLHSGILRNWSRETEEFRVLFMQAKEYIGINRLKASQNETLDTSIYRAHIGNYDIDVNEYMREEKTFEASLKMPETTTTCPLQDSLDKDHTIIKQQAEIAILKLAAALNAS